VIPLSALRPRERGDSPVRRFLDLRRSVVDRLVVFLGSAVVLLCRRPSTVSALPTRSAHPQPANIPAVNSVVDSRVRFESFDGTDHGVRGAGVALRA